MELEEEILLFLKNGAVKDKYLMTHLMNKGFSKGMIRNALEDLYFYGFILKRPTMKRGVYELTELGKIEVLDKGLRGEAPLY
jgi:predicted transcriptional regulator